MSLLGGGASPVVTIVSSSDTIRTYSTWLVLMRVYDSAYSEKTQPLWILIAIYNFTLVGKVVLIMAKIIYLNLFHSFLGKGLSS